MRCVTSAGYSCGGGRFTGGLWEGKSPSRTVIGLLLWCFTLFTVDRRQYIYIYIRRLSYWQQFLCVIFCVLFQVRSRFSRYSAALWSRQCFVIHWHIWTATWAGPGPPATLTTVWGISYENFTASWHKLQLSGDSSLTHLPIHCPPGLQINTKIALRSFSFPVNRSQQRSHDSICFNMDVMNSVQCNLGRTAALWAISTVRNAVELCHERPVPPRLYERVMHAVKEGTDPYITFHPIRKLVAGLYVHRGLPGNWGDQPSRHWARYKSTITRPKEMERKYIQALYLHLFGWRRGDVKLLASDQLTWFNFTLHIWRLLVLFLVACVPALMVWCNYLTPAVTCVTTSVACDCRTLISLQYCHKQSQKVRNKW